MLCLQSAREPKTGQALGKTREEKALPRKQEGGTLSALPGLGSKVLVAAPAEIP